MTTKQAKRQAAKIIFYWVKQARYELRNANYKALSYDDTTLIQRYIYQYEKKIKRLLSR